MKNYFTSDLKGTKLFVPIFVLILFVVGLVTWSAIIWNEERGALMDGQPYYTLLSPQTPVDGSYFVRLIASLGAGIGYLLVVYGILFFLVKQTLGSLKYKEEKFDASDMKFGAFFVRILGWTALTMVTCFIYLPWFITNIMRWFASHTSFRDKTFRFNGSGSILFGFAVLCYILPVIAIAIMMMLFTALVEGGFLLLIAYVAMLAILLFCSLFYAFLIRWRVDFDYDGKQISASTMRTGRTMWFMFGQLLLTVITFGFYTPAFMMRLVRYTLRNTTVVDGEGTISRQGGYDFHTSDYWFILGQLVLSYITFGIYAAWAYAAIIRRIASRSFTE